MDSQQIGWILGWGGGVLGSLLGILGGVLGTVIPYRLAKTPRQKSFVLKSAAYFWILVLVFLAALWFVPSPFNLLVWIPYIIVLLCSINWLNQRQRRMLEEEAAASSGAKP